jgi:hypothetical protein
MQKYDVKTAGLQNTVETKNTISTSFLRTSPTIFGSFWTIETTVAVMLESALVAFAVALSDFVSFERSSKTALAAGEEEAVAARKRDA